MKRKKVGLVLGSGGARGFAHLGVIKALEENEIPIDLIVGTSAGAIVGGVYSYFKNYRKTEEEFFKFKWRQVLRRFVMRQRIDEIYHSVFGEITFEELKIPFRAVAFDFQKLEPVVLKEGDVGSAMEASGCLPHLWQKISWGKRNLYDGGLAVPLPVKEAKKMGADILVAANLNSKKVVNKNYKTRIGPLGIKFYLETLQHYLIKEQSREADFLIEPEIKKLSFWDWRSPQKIIERRIESAEKATLPFIKQLKRNLKND